MTRVHRFARKLKAGTVWVNTFGPTDVRLPWGGSRDSGFGREHGDMAIENFTESEGGLDQYRPHRLIGCGGSGGGESPPSRAPRRRRSLPPFGTARDR